MTPKYNRNPRRKASVKNRTQTSSLVTGVIAPTRSGDGRITDSESGKSILIRRRFLDTALPGDKVGVRVFKTSQSDELLSGKVVRVIERARRDVVATLGRRGKRWFANPFAPCYPDEFAVVGKHSGKSGDRVVLRFVDWESRRALPRGQVVEVLGRADSPSVDTISVIRQYGFRDTFSDEVMREAERASALMDDPGDREDCRNKYIITVDPETARDFDDALSLEKDRQGNRILGVYIADVSHFVTKGGPLDREAERRGNTIYLPDKVIPMLPEQLSNGICSLQPKKDRLAFAAFITFNATGEPRSWRFAKTLICSNQRLTYKDALNRLRGSRGKDKTIALLKDLNKLAQDLRKRRFAKYALDLDMPECEVVLDDEGRTVDIRPVENDISHQLIEECMIAANEAVATELAKRGIQLISRVHDAPSRKQIDSLREELAAMGYMPSNIHEASGLSAFLKSTKDDPLGHHLRVAVLRSMNRAIYTSQRKGHFGLAKKHYAHFTSPIRRYPDLVAHRQLSACLGGRSQDRYGGKRLERIAEHCSTTEREAEEAERAVVEIKKIRYLKNRIGVDSVFDAVVVRVMRVGCFVEIPNLQIQGLLPAEAFLASRSHFDPQKQAFRVGKQVFKVGMSVSVQVSSVDMSRRRVNFELAE